MLRNLPLKYTIDSIQSTIIPLIRYRDLLSKCSHHPVATIRKIFTDFSKLFVCVCVKMILPYPSYFYVRRESDTIPISLYYEHARYNKKTNEKC